MLKMKTTTKQFGRLYVFSICPNPNSCWCVVFAVPFKVGCSISSFLIWKNTSVKNAWKEKRTPSQDAAHRYRTEQSRSNMGHRIKCKIWLPVHHVWQQVHNGLRQMWFINRFRRDDVIAKLKFQSCIMFSHICTLPTFWNVAVRKVLISVTRWKSSTWFKTKLCHCAERIVFDWSLSVRFQMRQIMTTFTIAKNQIVFLRSILLGVKIAPCCVKCF